MPIPAVLLLTSEPLPPLPKTLPWWGEWLLSLPAGIIIMLAIGWVLLKVATKPLENFLQQVFDLFAARMKNTSKQPALELRRKALKSIALEQMAERLRIESRCDHVELYAVQNGEYLRTGEGVDKFSMQAEAVRPGDAHYMDVERVLYAMDMPRLIALLESGEPYALLWHNRCDDWKANKIMSERDYASSILVFIRRPTGKNGPAGVIGLLWMSWRETEIYRTDQFPLPATHPGPTRQLDTLLEQLLTEYCLEFSYQM